ncbi:MAG TPA: hypothetical protein VFQ85_07725 [Mycobacteriales bacterium]|nr:hypothetical protein [Mycobacteriales bacterium]
MTGVESVIRPAAILGIAAATEILRCLEQFDVSRGGVWSATPGMWQRFDRPWNGPSGSRGGAVMVGSIAVVYDEPRRNEITIYKVNVTDPGLALGWTVDRLCDDALAWAGLTLATCPRATLRQPPRADPFHLPAQRGVTLDAWSTSSYSATRSGAGG